MCYQNELSSARSVKLPCVEHFQSFNKWSPKKITIQPGALSPGHFNISVAATAAPRHSSSIKIGVLVPIAVAAAVAVFYGANE